MVEKAMTTLDDKSLAEMKGFARPATIARPLQQ